ncbi:hypothetical protein KFE25_008593 [Diacronema lutheri]|uniref:Uncharacterized protein n=1 Tax=Diacronema lutheri TaxID=2081491 RepID=A0A8J5XJ92_DIALT|nr:hypothetical protein KFE25_008591 [Diacronema lutheri]KAG8470171.1 hypothetical protein KFE25_008592 [Diacronema lutheri]KAG8470172.1 hypothetical protein KFE25_008593 [Diacronema lutheri]
MGGTADRVEMMLPDSAPRSSGTAGASHALDVQREIDAFDVRRASCFRREEREKLLTVIEVGFGGLSVFNEVLVALLNAAMRRLDAKELSERLRASRRTMDRLLPNHTCDQPPDSRQSGSLPHASTCARMSRHHGWHMRVPHFTWSGWNMLTQHVGLTHVPPAEQRAEKLESGA